MSRYAFLVDTYRTERLKILGVWSQIPDEYMHVRPEPRARSPLEQMVHQCLSEDGWMTAMLGIAVTIPALPVEETRLAFFSHTTPRCRNSASRRSKPELTRGSRRRRSSSTSHARAPG